MNMPFRDRIIFLKTSTMDYVNMCIKYLWDAHGNRSDFLDEDGCRGKQMTPEAWRLLLLYT